MKKILIVDDEKNIRLSLKQCLAAEEYDVEIALNGTEGYEKLKDGAYDLVLLDMKMPGLDGMEVLEKIHQEQIDTSVVMMTAYGTIEKAVEAMKMGAIDFLKKPFAPEEIRKIVREVLKRRDLVPETLESAEDLFQYAKKCILSGDYQDAKKYLTDAIAKDTEAPQPHNLLGVLFEFEGDISQAQKHYRAALALDATYQPADKNLERTAQYHYTKKGINLG